MFSFNLVAGYPIWFTIVKEGQLLYEQRRVFYCITFGFSSLG